MTVRGSYSIGDLANAAGVSRRTVRFYVQRDLLPPPEGLGRGARYTDQHLARLLQIKTWQEQGVPLEEIRARLAEERPTARAGARGADRPGRGEAGPDAPLRGFSFRAGSAKRGKPAPGDMAAWSSHAVPDAPGTAWFRQPLVAGFELNVAADRGPLTARQLAALARALGDILENGGEEE